MFTLPGPLRAIAPANPRFVYELLLDAASATLVDLAADRPKARLGVTAVLHTWRRDLGLHPHLHCVVTGGGLSLDDLTWVPCHDAFLFPVKVMGALFRGKFMAGLVAAYGHGHRFGHQDRSELAEGATPPVRRRGGGGAVSAPSWGRASAPTKQKGLQSSFRRLGRNDDRSLAAYKAGDLHFAGTSAGLAHPVAFATMRAELYATDWVVFAKRPFGGPKQVLAYLSRYTHRVAISDARIRFADEDRVVIKTRGDRTATMAPDEFIRRLLLHVLPRQFRKIRHYGLLAPANVNTRLVAARRALEALGATLDRDSTPAASADTSGDAIVMAPFPTRRCLYCGSERHCREPLPAAARGPPRGAQ